LLQPPQTDNYIEQKMAQVTVRFKAIGNVDQIHPTSASFPINAKYKQLQFHVAEQLKLPKSQPIWVYVGNAYVPDPELPLISVPGVGTGSGELVVSYSLIEAFG
jgi:hypothetical protein